MKSLRFPPAAKMKRSADFERVYKRARRSGDGLLLVFARENTLGLTRIGLSVSRKFGSAVRRNRVKRVLREAFRLSRDCIPPGMDLILIPRPGITPRLEQLRLSLIRTAEILARKLAAKRDQDPQQ